MSRGARYVVLGGPRGYLCYRPVRDHGDGSHTDRWHPLFRFRMPRGGVSRDAVLGAALRGWELAK